MSHIVLAPWCVYLALSVVQDASAPGKVIQEMPTLKSLGVRWIIAGDENRNARVLVGYRQAGSTEWKRGLDLFRVDRQAVRSDHRPPVGQTLFAGSIFNLQENTEYDVKLVLKDPDGGGTERSLHMKSWSEPHLPVGRKTIHVYPGKLAAAIKRSRPGDILLLHAGVYRGAFRPVSGTPKLPIAFMGARDGEAVLDGQGGTKIIDGYALHDLMFQGLTFRNAKWALTFNEGARITLRRCTITDVDYAFSAQRNGARQQRIFIADCLMRGRSRWPRSEGIEGRRGIQLGGTGHVVCYNSISHFADGIDTFGAYPTCAIDIYGNEISECTDDGIELDFSEHNTRCFDNRLTNVFQGISAQPVHGGPVYIFRNAIYNIGLSTFKLHNSPSGVLMFHNTSVKVGMPLSLLTHEPVSNCLSRNNLFVGTVGNYAYEDLAPMRNCDFDYDGFAGTWKLFMKYNGVRYPSMAVARTDAPVYRHGIRIDASRLFTSGVKPPMDVATQANVRTNDLRLGEHTRAIDAGVVLPNINDGYRGAAPDLGAYEFRTEMPHYGPRDGSTRFCRSRR